MPDALEQLASVLGPLWERQKGRAFGLADVFKHDSAATPGSVYSHGPGGNLVWPGVDPAVFNATMGGRSLLSQLPAVPSLQTNPTYFTITGVQGDTGSEMSGICDNAPTAGLMKSCLVTSVFGRYERATPSIDIGRLGARTDRADPLDLRLVNSPMNVGLPFAGAGGGLGNAPGDVLTNEVARKFWERNVSFQRLLAKQLWRGNPSTGNSAGGGYKEMTGLQLLVNTGYVDADANVACPAMDSYVRAFNYGRIDLATGANNLVATLTDMVYQLESRADRAGVSPVRFALAMRPQLFYQITAIWPCTYLTTNCLTSSAGTPLNMDAQDVVRFRDEMRAGEYLLIDGKRYDVILDDGIIEYDGNSSGGFPRGCFATDIYVLPMSMVGGQSTLYLEYFQYNNPSVNDAFGSMVLGRAEGAFLTWPRQTNMCVEWQSRIEPRLVLRTPWLAGRISNVVYCPIQHERETFPEEPYFANGGRTSRTGPSYHSLWAA